MSRKILADTSVWIEYFKNNANVSNFMEKHLLDGTVYIVGIIISELIQGIKTEKERELIRSNLDAINYLDMKFEDWLQAGDISNKLRKGGVTVPLTDIAIAAAAMGNDLTLVTRDSHFKQIPGLNIMEI